jgi:hypothetical protein
MRRYKIFLICVLSVLLTGVAQADFWERTDPRDYLTAYAADPCSADHLLSLLTSTADVYKIPIPHEEVELFISGPTMTFSTSSFLTGSQTVTNMYGSTYGSTNTAIPMTCINNVCRQFDPPTQSSTEKLRDEARALEEQARQKYQEADALERKARLNTDIGKTLQLCLGQYMVRAAGVQDKSAPR